MRVYICQTTDKHGQTYYKVSRKNQKGTFELIGTCPRIKYFDKK